MVLQLLGAKINSQSKKIKVAVIGHGHLGRWHAEKVEQNPLSQLYAIIEADPSRAADIKQKYPDTIISSSIDEVIEDIDAALVITPTSTHYKIVKKLLKHQIHIFCEKPLCSSYEQAKELRELYQEKNVIFQVGHSERFHHIWRTINQNSYYKKFLDEVGTLRVSRLAPFKGRATDVDVVQDLMVHDIDLLVFLFGQIPKSVKSTGYKIRTSNWDYVCSEFLFEQGRRAILTVGRNHVKEVREMEYTNKLGCMYIDMFQSELLLAPNTEIPEKNKKISPFVEVLSYEKQDHLFVEQNHFYESILNNGQSVVTIDDGVLAVKLISKVLESLETGSEVLI